MSNTSNKFIDKERRRLYNKLGNKIKDISVINNFTILILADDACLAETRAEETIIKLIITTDKDEFNRLKSQ